MLINIPFQGFYNSIHDYNFDNELENYLPEYTPLELVQEFCGEFSYNKKILNDYCKFYVEKLNYELDGLFDLVYESLQSPREYNFETDRIFCSVELCKVQAMFFSVDKTIFSKACQDRFTSHDGFISSYDPDYRLWGSIETWDHNQLGTLLEVYINENLSDEWEFYLMDDYQGNGYLSESIYQGLSDRGLEILKTTEENYYE